jgi:hypothetical protein
MNLEGLEKSELTIEPAQANIKAVALMFPIVAMVVSPYYILWKHAITLDSLKSFKDNNPTWMAYGTMIALGVIIIGIVFHEIIHGITWSRFANGGFRSIRFGILWRELTPYCHCEETLLVRHYRIGTIMPAIILGIVPSLMAYFTGNVWLIAFGVFFTMAAAGDYDYQYVEK